MAAEVAQAGAELKEFEVAYEMTPMDTTNKGPRRQDIQGSWPGTPKKRIRNQICYIGEYDNQPDILFLQEVSKYRTEIREYLWEIGNHTIKDTLEWATELGKQ